MTASETVKQFAADLGRDYIAMHTAAEPTKQRTHCLDLLPPERDGLRCLGVLSGLETLKAAYRHADGRLYRVRITPVEEGK